MKVGFRFGVRLAALVDARSQVPCADVNQSCRYAYSLGTMPFCSLSLCFLYLLPVIGGDEW